MKNSTIAKISGALALSLLLPLLASCNGNAGNTETDTSAESESVSVSQSESASAEESLEKQTADSESVTNIGQSEESESDTEKNTEASLPAPTLEGPYADLITLSNKLANGVQVYYPSATRSSLVIQNQNAVLTYITAPFESKTVQSIKNTSGKSYVENTMDVYVKMKDRDDLYFASESPTPATMNLYRYGYYYYQVLLNGQYFSGDPTVEKELKLNIEPDGTFNMKKAKASEKGNVAFEVTSTYDPRIHYKASFKPFAAADYNYIAVTMKVTSAKATSIVSSSVWLAAGAQTNFNSSQTVGFRPMADGEFHTYYVRIDQVKDYTGKVTGLRFDLDGSVGDVFEIKEIKAVKAKQSDAPELALNRVFNTFSDKIVQTLQITAKDDTVDIDEIGMITEINANTVAKLIVKDAKGTHTTLDTVDWNSSEYVGFDIKDVGVFGYILLPDATSGNLQVTLENGQYKIKQYRAPKDGTLLVPNQETLHTGDFYMGQRIYTDESHDFTAFLNEAYCERNPLSAENFIIDEKASTAGKYVGYNALRGTYEFTLEDSGFNTAYYKEQNKHHNVKFTVKGDGYDRTIYMETAISSGQLESAVLLTDEDLLLPIPVEVCKNFSDGDKTIHWIKDITSSNTYLPISVEKNGEFTVKLIHLYQNWGRFPLKQLSSIQFHCPYYHLSTGVTETNCIVPWYTTNGARNIYSVLPDHRAMSAPFWLREPQHTSGGSHGFLEYTDSDGNYSATENVKNTIVSYGPTYAEIVMDYISDDGKIRASYTHMEMPQVDENRTYYTMEYEVLEDVSFKNFSEDFIFYTVSPKSGVTYQNIGYLAEGNKPTTRPANTKDAARTYILGDNCPYFSLYQDDDCQASDGYVNLAFLIRSAEFVIGGEKTEPSFLISDLNNTIRLSLDLGEVTLKAGDRFTINAIILPWGSQVSDYSLADKNVRDVREDSLLHPLKATADADCAVKETAFLPTIRTSNGKSAEFTLEGGANNCTVKLEGFPAMTVPTVLEKIDGEWVRYNLSSRYYLDNSGFGQDYDGYGIMYEADGFFSYSFVVDMGENGEARSFKVIVDEASFIPEVEPPKEIETETPEIGIIEGYNRYYDVKELENKAAAAKGFGKKVVSEDGSYISFYGDGSHNDPQIYVHSMINESNPLPTGRYFVFKYRIPSTNAAGDYFAIFTSTESPSASGSSCVSYTNILKDDQWHVVVIDCAAILPQTYLPAKDGGYYSQHVRFDIFNRVTATTDRVDFAYIGFEDDFYAFLEANKDMDDVTFYNGTYHTIPTEGGRLPVNFEDDTDENTTPLNLYLSPKKLAYQAAKKGSDIGIVTLADDESYISIFSKPGVGDSYFRAYTAEGDPSVTGQYLIFKYRASGTQMNCFEIYASTVNGSQSAGDNFYLTADKGLYSIEDEWNIVVVDMSAIRTDTVVANDDGEYAVKYLRFDVFNMRYDTDEYRVDLAYMGICDDLTVALTFDSTVPTAIYYNGTEKTVHSTENGDKIS